MLTNHFARRLVLLSAFLGTLCTTSIAWAQMSILPVDVPRTPIEKWETKIGDFFVADTQTNIGYLVHKEGGYTSFVIGSGQRKVVHYAQQTYDASTPSQHWTVLEKDHQNDAYTFGERGIFMRLFVDGDGTKYGIHSTKYINSILANSDRYKSMGCVLVSESVLDIIVNTYEWNGDKLEVYTTDGFGTQSVTYDTLKKFAESSKTIAKN